MNILARAMTDLERTVRERTDALKQYEKDCIKAVVEVDDCPNFSSKGCDRDGPCICDRIAKAVLAVRRP